MAESSDKELSIVVDIAAAGDIILVVGPEKLQLRVQSLILKAASKPFSAMLGPNWKEGRHTLRDIPVEILLPEDDPIALKYICAIAHHQNKMVPKILAVRDILGVAIMADKYDFVDTLTFASGTWLQPQNKEPDELMVLATSALLFQDTQAFKAITKALILNYGGSYLSLLGRDIESVMSWKVFYLLEEQRSFARLKLEEILLRGIDSGGCCHKCGWSSKYAYAYLQLLKENNLWPTSLVGISEAIARAERMPDPVPTEASIDCRYGYKHAVPEYRADRRWALDDLRDRCGLCLPCVRLGKTDSAYCGITHEHYPLLC